VFDFWNLCAVGLHLWYFIIIHLY